MARHMLVFQRDIATLLFTRRSRGRLNVMATYNTFCYIDHTVTIVTGSCHFCEPSPVAVIKRLEPD